MTQGASALRTLPKLVVANGKALAHKAVLANRRMSDKPVQARGFPHHLFYAC
ncbi:hypothetical protein [Nostoc sp.]|uniref:hypothetical protein n=1 Tax=Nostoc sp. TaxID=1180 RepID=UPI002FFBB633